jgi:hypothetical protein
MESKNLNRYSWNADQFNRPALQRGAAREHHV